MNPLASLLFVVLLLSSVVMAEVPHVSHLPSKADDLTEVSNEALWRAVRSEGIEAPAAIRQLVNRGEDVSEVFKSSNQMLRWITAKEVAESGGTLGREMIQDEFNSALKIFQGVVQKFGDDRKPSASAVTLRLGSILISYGDFRAIGIASDIAHRSQDVGERQTAILLLIEARQKIDAIRDRLRSDFESIRKVESDPVNRGFIRSITD